jgi:hypothetical protein
MLDHASVQNYVFFRMLDPGILGENEVSSREVSLQLVLGVFSVGDNHERFLFGEDLIV